MNQDIKKPQKKRKTPAQKKKAAVQKALFLMGLICVLGTIALLALQPDNSLAETQETAAAADRKKSRTEDAPEKTAPPSDKDSPSPHIQEQPPAPVTEPPAKDPVQKNSGSTGQQKDSSKPPAAVPLPEKAPPVTPSVPEHTAVIPPATAHKGTLIFVFDDAGHNLTQLKPFLQLPFPITVAVLPGLPKTKEAAAAVAAAGKELILHQPMQAINPEMDPGPGSIQPGMTFSQITDILLENTIPLGSALKGINNHEGSLITADAVSMRAVLEFCRDRGLYFLDSRTTALSVAQEQANLLDITIWERAVFLDNTQNTDDIIAAVRSGMNIAEKKGNAILIGHIWSNTLAQTLQDLYPELVNQGFSMSTIAQIAAYGE